MTLLVSVGCEDFVLQVSDRRFTSRYANGRETVASDEGNKELVVRSPKLLAAVTFTGLAVTACKPTGDWLQDVIRPDDAEAGFEGVLDAVLKAANHPEQPPFRYGGQPVPHAFVIAGYETGDPRPRAATITNCGDPRFGTREAVESFRLFVQPPGERFILTAGCFAALPQMALPTIRGLLRKRTGYASVADAVVQQIRAAARHGKLGKYIGQNCMSVHLTPAGAAESVYHPIHGRPEWYGPNVLEAFASQGGGAMKFQGVVARGRPSVLGIGSRGLTVLDRRMLKRERRSE